MPLHVSDAPDRLDLRDLGSELGAVLVLALLKQVLVASVARILIADPAGTEQNRTGERQLQVRGRRVAPAGTHVPL